MKCIISKFVWIAAISFLAGCSKNEPVISVASNYTGNEVTYPLVPASDYPIYGTVVFKERKDGFTAVVISLNGIEGGTGAEFPVHLHAGDLSEEKANVASLLQPVNGTTGKSETLLKQLVDGSVVTYSDLKVVNACIKIHLSYTGEAANIILSAGNIGSAVASVTTPGRLAIGICKSE